MHVFTLRNVKTENMLQFKIKNRFNLLQSQIFIKSQLAFDQTAKAANCWWHYQYLLAADTSDNIMILYNTKCITKNYFYGFKPKKLNCKFIYQKMHFRQDFAKCGTQKFMKIILFEKLNKKQINMRKETEDCCNKNFLSW